MALFNFECHRNTKLDRRAAKLQHSAVTNKKCTLAVVINERDYIKPDSDNCVQKTTSKLKLVSFKALYNAEGKKCGWGGEVL